MLSINAKIIPGTGAGPVNLPRQLPRFEEEFPEIRSVSRNFITLQLDRPLLVMAADHRTRPIHWDETNPDGEVFDFLRVQLEAPIGSDPISCWLYVAHWSQFRETPTQHELVGPAIDLPDGTECRLIIERHASFLPYKSWEAAIV